MTNEIAVRGIDDAARISKALADSGFYKDVKTAAQAMVKVMAGIELGITPLAAMSGIHIVEGRTTLGSGLVASQIQRSGKFRHRIVELSKERCELEFQEYEDGKWQKMNPNSVFSMEDAKRAELTGKANWRKYPEAMLFARAITQGARMHTPSVFGGPIYTPEELGDNDVSKTIDVPSEVIEEQKTTPPVEQPKAEAPKPTKELPTNAMMQEIQKLSENLALTNKERTAIRNEAAQWDKETATSELAALKLKVADRSTQGVSDGQIEYAGVLFGNAGTLFTQEEVTKSMEGLKAAGDFKTANEKIVKILAAVNSRKKKAEDAAKAKASPNGTTKAEILQAIADAVIINENAPDGPTDDNEATAF